MSLSDNLIIKESHVRSKFGRIPPSRLDGDCVTDKCTYDGRTDELTHRKIMLLSHSLTIRESSVVSLLEFRQSV